MKIEGGCHCGQILYQAEADPAKAGICHCTDCQTLSGSAFRTLLMVPGESFKLLRGEPKIYMKVGDSGNRRRQAFCGECGSAIYASADEDSPEVFNLRLGTVNQRDRFPPVFQVWCRSMQTWLPEMDSIKKADKQ